MPVSSKDESINLDKLLSGMAYLDSHDIVVGVRGEEGSQIQVIASSNEFGAIIRSKKAIQFLAMKAKELGIKLNGTKKGYIEIPERSFIRSTASDVGTYNDFVETASFYLRRFLEAKNTAEEVLERAGQVMKLAIQSRIMQGINPKNHPVTVAEKKHSETLLGEKKGTNKNSLIQSIGFEIVKK